MRHQIISYLTILSLPLSRGCCFAFSSGANHGLLQKNLGPSPTEPQQFSRSTSLFGERRDEDIGEDEDDRPINDLDIFGQPKDKQTKRKNAFEEEGDIRGRDRIKSCIPYMLPLIDGDTFGKYIYDRIPPLGALDYVILRPFVAAQQAMPVLGILLFLTFALGPQLTNQSREVRFNAQQAILIDVALIFPSIIGESIAEADANLPRSITEPGSNFIWYCYVSLVIYCIISNLRGKIPDQIPFISAVANMAVGPF